MERIRITLLDNIRNVAWLEKYPTHQLRAFNHTSCVPEILHEARPMASIARMLSGDSRKTVLSAIEQTLLLIVDGMPTTSSFIETICIYKNRFVRGVSTLQTHYENDMYVTTVIDRILSVWSQIVYIITGHPVVTREVSMTEGMIMTGPSRATVHGSKTCLVGSRSLLDSSSQIQHK